MSFTRYDGSGLRNSSRAIDGPVEAEIGEEGGQARLPSVPLLSCDERLDGTGRGVLYSRQ